MTCRSCHVTSLTAFLPGTCSSLARGPRQGRYCDVLTPSISCSLSLHFFPSKILSANSRYCTDRSRSNCLFYIKKTVYSWLLILTFFTLLVFRQFGMSHNIICPTRSDKNVRRTIDTIGIEPCTPRI